VNHPSTTAGLLHGAAQALRSGQPIQAQACCDQLLRQDPRNADAWRMLAMVRQMQRNMAGAGEAMARAYALRPQDPGIALEFGSWLLQQGQASQARGPLRIAMDALPGDARAAFRYGTASFLDNDFAQASVGFEAATQRHPQWSEAWNNLSAALGRRQLYPAAIEAAKQALKLKPDTATSHQALAALLSNLFDSESLREGAEAAGRALALAPDYAEAHRTLSILQRKLGDPARAEAHARRAHALMPRDPDMVETLGEQLVLNGRAAEAIEVYADAANAGLRSPTLDRQHGIALLTEGRTAQAQEVLMDVVQAQPSDQRAIAHLGVAMAARGRLEQAAELIGLHRHIHAMALPPPPDFADASKFNATLADDIRRHSQQRWEPVGLAARGAYLSGDLLADRTPAILGFEQRLREAVDRFIADCRAQPEAVRANDAFLAGIPDRYRLHVWATQAAQSGYVDTHIHEESWLSGAYYVELPPAIRSDDPTHAGWIEFGRPYPSLPPWPEDAMRRVVPEVGTLLLFPSYLFHRTLPYSGEGERISISFDLAAA
jgi:uncharacterized protein (TIGR02466 family)